MKDRMVRLTSACAAVAALLIAAEVRAQVTPAAGYTPPDDTPKINVGITLFADYSYQDTPTVVDGDKVTIHKNAFNLTRAYINVTGSLSHWFSFRVTPDIKAETNSASNLNGNQVVRLKYGYGQVNFDDFAPRGSWLRFGLQQTPYIDYVEGPYRYRFQGATFTDVEGFLISSDYGVSTRFAFPMNYGDVHVGVYNGEGYQSQADQTGTGTNNEKSIQIRASLRPAPGVPVLKGLRVAGLYDSDHYFSDAKRERFVGTLTFEHPYVNAGFEYLDAKDKTTSTKLELDRDGFSAWVTPRTPFGIEGLFRYDELVQDKNATPRPKKKRTVLGVAYWPPLEGGKTIAFMADYSEVKFDHVTPDPGKTKIYALHTLFNF